MTRRPRVGARHTVLVAMVAALVVGALPAAAAAASTDPDKDGLPSAWETTWSRTNPRKKDTDKDGILDGKEDPDRDTLNNRQEYLSGMKPRRADSDKDGIRDDKEDTDKDGLKTKFEFTAGTKPKVKDSDKDGLRDDREDPDKDGLTNRSEQSRGTHPTRRDTDGDGYSDGWEVTYGTNPLDAASHPVPPPPGAVPTLPGISDCSVFPADNVWNARIDHLRRRLELRDDGLDDRPERRPAPGLRLVRGLRHPVQRRDLGDPDARPSRSTTTTSPTTSRTRSRPARRSRAAGDRHILMVDADACRLYELFDARKVDGGWRAGCGAIWDMRSNALRTAGWTSADAAGLPILPGLVRYDEVAAGAINHALRFTHRRDPQAVHLPGAPLRQRLDLCVAAADGPARAAQGLAYDIVRLLAPGPGHRSRRSSSTA